MILLHTAVTNFATVLLMHILRHPYLYIDELALCSFSRSFIVLHMEWVAMLCAEKYREGLVRSRGDPSGEQQDDLVCD